MLDSAIRRYNLAGVNLSSESDAAANPSQRLIASAGGTAMRVLARGLTGVGSIVLAFDQATFRNMDPSGAVASPDAFLMAASFGTPTERVFILAPGQKLYAASFDGALLINVATSDSVEIHEVQRQAHRASGIPSRLYTVRLPIDNATGDASQASINNPPLLATAPDWSPMRVTLSVPSEQGLDVSEDPDLLRQGGSGSPFSVVGGTKVTFVLAPNQSIYGLGSAAPFSGGARISVSTTLFTDVFNTTPLVKPSRSEEMRVLWNNLWQGSDGACF